MGQTREPVLVEALASTQPCPPASFAIGFSLNPCPRKPGAPYRLSHDHATSSCCDAMSLCAMLVRDHFLRGQLWRISRIGGAQSSGPFNGAERIRHLKIFSTNLREEKHTAICVALSRTSCASTLRSTKRLPTWRSNSQLAPARPRLVYSLENGLVNQENERHTYRSRINLLARQYWKRNASGLNARIFGARENHVMLWKWVASRLARQSPLRHTRIFLMSIRLFKNATFYYSMTPTAANITRRTCGQLVCGARRSRRFTTAC